MRRWIVAGGLGLSTALLAGCTTTAGTVAAAPTPSPATTPNPFFNTWRTPFGAAPFDQIRPEHFLPAFERGMAQQRDEVAAIASQSAAPTFANTIEALERSGRLLSQVQDIFFTLASSESNDAIRAIQRELAPKLSRHGSQILLDPRLFARVSALHGSAASDPRLDAEQKRLIERYWRNMVRAGAALDATGRERAAELAARQAELSTRFSQNLLAETAAFTLELRSEADFAGLPASVRDAALEEGRARGRPAGVGVITLQRPSVEPFLTFSSNRALREQAWRAWISRGDNGNEYDNRAVIAELLRIRAERARLLGFASHAHFVLEDTMARTPEAALALMRLVWEPARQRAQQERADLQALIHAEGETYALAGWDWRYFAEKARKLRFDLSEDELKPYFSLESMIEAQFYVASRLFGLEFAERKDIPVYHPDVRVWEVRDATGRHVGLFYGDYFARPSKQSGAWMSSLRDQERFDGEVTPLVVNNLNISKPPPGQPALLTYDDAETLFHEFGHALHGLLSNVRYPTLAGTAVPRDFVEFPAQIYEHWLGEPQVLDKFARHYRTGEPMPEALRERLTRTRTFNQGFATVEFLASCFVDMQMHLLSSEEAQNVDARTFERQVLERIGMVDEIAMRHRSPHFAHIFAGGYSAGYYSYLWSEILDADGFDAFKQAGDIFDPATARRLYEFVYASGNLRDPMQAYLAFRGREPSVDPLLRNRGLLAQEQPGDRAPIPTASPRRAGTR